MNPKTPEDSPCGCDDPGKIREELQRMFAELERGRPEVQPSKYWIALNQSDQGQLLAVGFENFRRTVAKHYFTWTKIWPWDAQIRFLMANLPLAATVADVFRTFLPPKHRHIPLLESWACNFLSNLAWDYAIRVWPDIERLSEPSVGNPPGIRRKGRLISQDLANSGLEAQFILSTVDGTRVRAVCELGAGYGRTAHALLSFLPGIRYVVVDIPPALYVAQRYLSTVHPNRKVFRWRPFHAYAEIREEFESADLAFLLPSQLESLPGEWFDLFINISSLHEMSLEQIRYYFAEIHRLTRRGGWFYLKQWKVSPRIPYHDFTIRKEDYPFAGWRVLADREARIQTHFFEALLQKP